MTHIPEMNEKSLAKQCLLLQAKSFTDNGIDVEALSVSAEKIYSDIGRGNPLLLNSTNILVGLKGQSLDDALNDMVNLSATLGKQDKLTTMMDELLIHALWIHNYELFEHVCSFFMKGKWQNQHYQPQLQVGRFLWERLSLSDIQFLKQSPCEVIYHTGSHVLTHSGLNGASSPIKALELLETDRLVDLIDSIPALSANTGWKDLNYLMSFIILGEISQALIPGDVLNSIAAKVFTAQLLDESVTYINDAYFRQLSADELIDIFTTARTRNGVSATTARRLEKGMMAGLYYLQTGGAYIKDYR